MAIAALHQARRSNFFNLQVLASSGDLKLYTRKRGGDRVYTSVTAEQVGQQRKQKHAPQAAAEIDWFVGAEVVLHGLLKAPQLNGVRGVITRVCEIAAGETEVRYEVRVGQHGGSRSVLVKGSNLSLPASLSGAPVDHVAALRRCVAL